MPYGKSERAMSRKYDVVVAFDRQEAVIPAIFILGIIAVIYFIRKGRTGAAAAR